MNEQVPSGLADDLVRSRVAAILAAGVALRLLQSV